jgi:hypothetical protein
MGLTEDTLRLASLCLRQFDGSIDGDCVLFDDRLCWYGSPPHRQLASSSSSGGNCQEPWLTVSENQLPNLREEQ